MAPLSQKLMTVKELAGYLKIDRSSVYRLLKQRKLPAFRVGADWRFKVEDVDRWRLNQPTASKPQRRSS